MGLKGEWEEGRGSGRGQQGEAQGMPPMDRNNVSHVERPPRCSKADRLGIVVVQVMVVFAVVIVVGVVVIVVAEFFLPR